VLGDVFVQRLAREYRHNVCERDVALVVVLPVLARLVRGLEMNEGVCDVSGSISGAAGSAPTGYTPVGSPVRMIVPR